MYTWTAKCKRSSEGISQQSMKSMKKACVKKMLRQLSCRALQALHRSRMCILGCGCCSCLILGGAATKATCVFIMTAIVTFMHAQLHTLYCACWASSQSTSDQPYEVLTHPAGTASMMPGTLCPQPRRYLGLSCCLQKQLGKTYNVFITFALRYIGFAALSQLLPALLSLGSRLTVSGQVLGLRCPLPAQSDLLHLRPCVSHWSDCV